MPPEFQRCALAALAAVGFLLVVQNFAFDLLPRRTVEVPAASIAPFSPGKTFGYVFRLEGAEPDVWPNLRSRVEFFEDGRRYGQRLRQADGVLLAGGDRFSHEPGRIIFSSTDNTDPRTNGRHYWLTEPILYGEAAGDTGIALLALGVGGLYLATRRTLAARAPDRPAARHPRAHLLGATALFLAGLYFNTGTLTPYAITTSPVVDPQTGFAYNPDHIHFRVLFDFVDGAQRSVWDHAILLRRILFTVVGWPLMKLLGFELGGTLTGLALNLGAFLLALAWIRRRIGLRGAVASGWLLALYPGAAYWVGLPYSYSLIFPSSLLLALALAELAEPLPVGRVAILSLGMGIAYLGYDLAAIFVPASVVVLLSRRRIGTAIASVLLQGAPLAGWLWMLSHPFRQSLHTPNADIYASVLRAYLPPFGVDRWLQALAHVPSIAGDVFFASNFVFLPLLFVFAVSVNPLTSRIRGHVSEIALLASGAALFVLLNAAPREMGGWEMRGTWISRIYQPVFPALVLFIARWWQALPALRWPQGAVVAAVLATTFAGNALVVFGPIAMNPLGVSETAFYRFYNHTDGHGVYVANLSSLGRRPLGFGEPPRVAKAEAPDIAAMLRQRRLQLAEVLRAVDDNRAAYRSVQRARCDVAVALAKAQSGLEATRASLQVALGKAGPGSVPRGPAPWESFLSPETKALLQAAPWQQPERAPAAAPAGLVQTQAALEAATRELSTLQSSLLQGQSELADLQRQLTQTLKDLEQARAAEAAALRR